MEIYERQYELKDDLNRYKPLILNKAKELALSDDSMVHLSVDSLDARVDSFISIMELSIKIKPKEIITIKGKDKEAVDVIYQIFENYKPDLGA